MPISKPFVIATEGRTVDGRTLPRDWLVQMAANYDPAVYTAVVNIGHVLFEHPESAFSAYGKVLSLGTQTANLLGQERLQLTAVVEATDEAAKLQAGGKKCFASTEIVPNFADSGTAYLTGLALTDTPASIGTQPMKFAMANGGPSSEQHSMGQETCLEFETIEPEKTEVRESILDKALNLLPQKARKEDSNKLESFAAEQQRLSARQSELAAEAMLLKADSANLKTALDALREEFDALKLALSTLDASATTRPPALGGRAIIKTDC